MILRAWLCWVPFEAGRRASTSGVWTGWVRRGGREGMRSGSGRGRGSVRGEGARWCFWATHGRTLGDVAATWTGARDGSGSWGSWDPGPEKVSPQRGHPQRCLEATKWMTCWHSPVRARAPTPIRSHSGSCTSTRGQTPGTRSRARPGSGTVETRARSRGRRGTRALRRTLR